MNNGRNGFTLTLKDHKLGMIGDNQFAIVAELSNGEKIEVLGSMTIINGESECNFSGMIPDRQFDIPARAETLEAVYEPVTVCS